MYLLVIEYMHLTNKHECINYIFFKSYEYLLNKIRIVDTVETKKYKLEFHTVISNK
jgi:hypothetical protein